MNQIVAEAYKLLLTEFGEPKNLNPEQEDESELEISGDSILVRMGVDGDDNVERRNGVFGQEWFILEENNNCYPK